ncbi:MAG: DUF2155 domain-containing protein [Maricaulaceae bacterium]
MRKFIAAFGSLFLLLSSAFGWAQTLNGLPQTPSQDVESLEDVGADIKLLAGANRVGDKVILRTLDKITAITRDFTVPVGDSLKFGTLTIDVKHCEAKPPEAIPETFAFLQIFEPPQDRKSRFSGNASEPIKIFSGWMLASKPAVSALDHGVYDVWIVACKGRDII